MTGTEIQTYIENRLGRSVDSDLVLEAINEGLDEIGDMGLLFVESDLTVTDTDTWYSLPSDYTEVIKVILTEDDEEYIYQNWEYRNGTIRFFDEEEFTVVARKMPEHLSEIADSFTDIHRLYHNGLKYYALAWIKENDNFEDPAAQMLYERFREKVARAAQKLINTKPPATVRVYRNA